MNFNVEDLDPIDHQFGHLHRHMQLTHLLTAVPRDMLTEIVEDGTFQNIIEGLPEGFWDALPDDFLWSYGMPPGFSAAHVEGMNLILSKLKSNFCLGWGFGFFNRDENDFVNFDHEAYSVLMASVAKANIKKVSFGLRSPRNCEQALEAGIQQFIRENSFFECLELWGEGKHIEETKMDEDGRYSRLLHAIMKTLDLDGTNASLKEIKFHWVSVCVSCQQFLGMLSRVPRGIAYFDGGRLDLIDDDGQMLEHEQACLLRELTIKDMHLTPKTLSILPNTLARCSILESLSITFDCRWANADANKQALVQIIKKVKAPKLHVGLTLDEGCIIEDILNALRDNKIIKKLSLHLDLPFSWTAKFNRTDINHFEAESPNGYDWLLYNKFHLMSKVLEESNTTLIDFNLDFKPSRLSHCQKEFDKVRYWTALNHYGRQKIREEGSHNIADILSNVQDEMAMEADGPYGIDGFASVAYGLLKESVAIHGDVRSNSSPALRGVKRKTTNSSNGRKHLCLNA